MKGLPVSSDKLDALTIANTVLGGGMSSRLFQKIREELGLAYSVYSYSSAYKDSGVLEIYAGVNTSMRDLAVEAIVKEVKNFKKEGLSEQEFLRSREQLKSGFILGQESTSSQMMLFGRRLLILDSEFDFNERLRQFEKVTREDVLEVINDCFDIEKALTSTVGPKRSAIKIN
jgi:predicted Zn-dependent peptidase